MLPFQAPPLAEGLLLPLLRASVAREVASTASTSYHLRRCRAPPYREQPRAGSRGGEITSHRGAPMTKRSPVLRFSIIVCLFSSAEYVPKIVESSSSSLSISYLMQQPPAKRLTLIGLVLPQPRPGRLSYHTSLTMERPSSATATRSRWAALSMSRRTGISDTASGCPRRSGAR